jgi:hypothetical protein
MEFCAPFPPGTGTEAMVGGFAVAGFEGAGPASDLLGVVGTVNILSGTRPIYAGLPMLVTPHLRQGQGFQIILRNRSGHLCCLFNVHNNSLRKLYLLDTKK